MLNHQQVFEGCGLVLVAAQAHDTTQAVYVFSATGPHVATFSAGHVRELARVFSAIVQDMDTAPLDEPRTLSCPPAIADEARAPARPWLLQDLAELRRAALEIFALGFRAGYGPDEAGERERILGEILAVAP